MRNSAVFFFLTLHSSLAFGANKIFFYEGTTPLIKAAAHGEFAAVQWLVKNRADVNAADITGNTSLHRVTENGSINIVKFLVDNGADINKANNRGETPLRPAVTMGT